jgi:hypothetical protein
LYTELRRFLGNAYRNVSVYTATNLQSTVAARKAITLLLEEVISTRFDQNLPQGENWPTEGKQNSEEFRSEAFILCGVVTVTFRVLSLFVVMNYYSYSKTESVIINCSSAWWISNKSNPLIACRVTRTRDNNKTITNMDSY